MSRILVIEDDNTMRMIVTRMLKSAGHEVDEASNGVEGLGVFKENEPDLIITDIVMPEKEGIETIRDLRHLVPDARIIAISGAVAYGAVANSYLRFAQRLGADEVLAKPFVAADLLRLIDRLLTDPRSDREDRPSGPR